MARQKSDAWRVGYLALLRFYENEALINERIEIAQTNTGGYCGGSKSLHQDIPASAAFRLESDKVYQRAKREVRAVGKVFSMLDSAEQQVIEQRFFRHRKGRRSPKDMRFIDAPMSQRSMWRLQKKVVLAVARELGEEL